MKRSDIPHLRLRCQHLSSAPLPDAVEVVRWLTAVQAQDYYGALSALSLRLENGIEAELDAMFNTGALLRTHVLRPTWHFVTPEDIRWLLQLTAPRVHAMNAGMYRQLELDDATRQHALSVMARALESGQYLTRPELGQALHQAGIPRTESGQRLTYLVMCAELDGLLCSGPRRGKQFTYALLDEWVPPAPECVRDEALAKLTRRYFWSHGPATVYDFANWSGLTVTDGRTGLSLVQNELDHAEIDGQTYWFAPDPPPAIAAPPRAFVLSVFDEYTIGYKDRRAIASEMVSARLGNLGNALTYLLVLDGQVIGSARRTLQKQTVTLELNSFLPLNPDEQQAIIVAAQRFGAFLEMQVELVWQ